ncbi:hypothetical protein Tco_1273402 [Tanacetum coccineum]
MSQLFSVLTSFLTTVEPKTYKDDLTQSCWIEAMQEELNEFERLEVWELVPRPDKVMVLIEVDLQSKADRRGGILKNKARIMARGNRQEKGIDFEQVFLLVVARLEAIRIFSSRLPLTEHGRLPNKYGFNSCEPVDTPMLEKSKLNEDKEGKAVDPSHYRGMIGTLLYLTASRPDLQFAICMCARWVPTGKTFTSSTTKVDCKPPNGSNEDITNPYECDQTLNVSAGIIFKCTQMIKRTAMASADNTSGPAPQRKERAKHIDIRYHFIKDKVENGIVELYFIRTEYQLADIFTKPLPRERFNFLIDKLGMRSMSSETLKSLAEETDE